MQRTVKEAFNCKRWAVIGATQTTYKFGYKIFKMLKDMGYDVVPINPAYTEVLGVKSYKSIREANSVQVVNMVVSPEKSFAMLDAIAEQGVEFIWFQPGTYDDKTIQRANDLGFKVIYNYCVLVELGSLPFCPID